MRRITWRLRTACSSAEHITSCSALFGVFLARAAVRNVSTVFSSLTPRAAVQNLSTPFGAFLDPVADKLMVSAVLILLCTKTFALGLFATYPALLQCLSVAIISRELAMSALREWAASLGPAARSVVAVNWVGKYKTTAQLVSLAMLTYAMDGGAGPLYEACAVAGPWVLVAAAALTLQSFAVYFAGIAKFML